MSPLPYAWVVVGGEWVTGGSVEVGWSIRIIWLHFRDEYHTPKSRFWPVHVAIHLLRLAKKKERGWNNH